MKLTFFFSCSIINFSILNLALYPPLTSRFLPMEPACKLVMPN